MYQLTFDKNTFYLDNEPFRIIAGDIHYFRIHEKRWASTLDLAIEFGLNTVQTYVPWNAHEPTPGKYDFDGMLDLGKFLALCHEKGLKVLLRPSPYICSEWDLGGLPAWLLQDRELVLRSSCPKYLEAVKRYYDNLIPVFLPYLASNNGPIIAVAVENEYGSYGNDRRYLDSLADMLRNGGVDVPLYTTDGDSEQMLTFGRTSEDLFFGVNYRAKPGTTQRAKAAADKYGKNHPFFIGEFWGGRSMHWGEPFSHRPPEETSIAFKEALENGGNVCFYMFAGGTNFGFMGGGNIGRSYSPREGSPVRYIPHTTSYDVDALINESGEPTEKYFLCKAVLDEYLGKKKKDPVYKKREKQFLSVSFSETADLFENLDALTEKKDFSVIPKPMEDYGQNYGLILYSTTLDAFDNQLLMIEPSVYRDRANFYVDGKWLASFTRDRRTVKIADGVRTIGGIPTITQNGTERKIDVLVENMGRINYGKDIVNERKGLSDAILSSSAKLFGYETRTLPLSDLSKIAWKKGEPANELPCFFKGHFDAKAGVDSYVDFSDFGHGYVWINGFNLGRYDSAGPQLTLFVPGELLKEKNNELIVLDIASTHNYTGIKLSDREILEGNSEEL